MCNCIYTITIGLRHSVMLDYITCQGDPPMFDDASEITVGVKGVEVKATFRTSREQ